MYTADRRVLELMDKVTDLANAISVGRSEPNVCPRRRRRGLRNVWFRLTFPTFRKDVSVRRGGNSRPSSWPASAWTLVVSILLWRFAGAQSARAPERASGSRSPFVTVGRRRSPLRRPAAPPLSTAGRKRPESGVPRTPRQRPCRPGLHNCSPRASAPLGIRRLVRY